MADDERASTALPITIPIASFVVLLDVRVVNVALPAGQTELGGSFDELRWIIAPYALTLVATMLTNHDRRMTMPVVSLSAGPIHYQKTGPPDGRPVVFVHGYAMGGSLWRPLTDRMAARGFLCVAPTWPLGAHSEPMREDAELTMEGIAAIIAETLDSLELDNVVLVGNDTGGAISQIVATTRPQRVGALVLTSCDAFEHFPPPVLKPLIAAAKMGPAFDTAIQPLRTRIGRKRAFGALAHAAIDPLVKEWVKPSLSNRRIRDDLRRFTASLAQRSTVEAAKRLPLFTKPALIAWSADDAFFPLKDGRRLADTLPNARFEVIQQSRTFSMIDQPETLADLIADFADADVTRPATDGPLERPFPAGTDRTQPATTQVT